MDHITQLYQNRAKVLQEEVNRLEALLEAMVTAPPIKVNWKAEKEQREKELEQQQKAAETASTLKAVETEKNEKAIQEHPIGAPIVGALKSAGESVGDIAKWVDQNRWYTGLGYLTGDYLLGKGIKTVTGKAGPGFPLTTAISKGLWSLTPQSIEAKEKAEKAVQAEKLAKEATRQVKLSGEMSELDRFGATLKPGIGREAYDPNTWIEGRPQGMGAPLETQGIPEKAYAAARRAGGSGVVLEPETLKRLQMRAYSGLPLGDPTAWKEAGEGLNDLVMTGKEVGKRSAQLAKGTLSAASKGLNALDPLSLGAEAVTPLLAGSEFASGVAMAPLAIGAFTSEAGKGSDIVAPTKQQIKDREEWAKEQRKQQGLAPVESITAPTSAVDAASLGSVTVAPEDREKLEKQTKGAKTSTPNLDRIQKQRQMMQTLQSGPSFFRP